MKVDYHRKFIKSYKIRVLRDPKLDKRFRERLNLFKQDPSNSLLRDHPLAGAKKHLRAFSVTGDFRVTYQRDGNTVTLIDIGTHNQVY